VGVGNGSSLGTFRKERKELKVDDLPRMPSLEGLGEELVEALESCRNIGTPVESFVEEGRTGEGRGVANSCASTSSVDVEGDCKDCEGYAAPGLTTELFAELCAGSRGGANN
jgi:hypothetical protein